MADGVLLERAKIWYDISARAAYKLNKAIGIPEIPLNIHLQIFGTMLKIQHEDAAT